MGAFTDDLIVPPGRVGVSLSKRQKIMVTSPSRQFPTTKRKIPSRPFPKTKRKLASRPFPKTKVKLPSRPFPTGTAKIPSRKPSKAKKVGHPTTEHESQARLAALTKTIGSLKTASELPTR
jgi:hypothetical protein